jgi:hypothetical protein
MIDGADLALARAGGAKAYLIRPLEPDRRNKCLDTTPLVSIPQRPQDWAMIAACEMTSSLHGAARLFMGAVARLIWPNRKCQ